MLDLGGGASRGEEREAEGRDGGQGGGREWTLHFCKQIAATTSSLNNL